MGLELRREPFRVVSWVSWLHSQFLCLMCFVARRRRSRHGLTVRLSDYLTGGPQDRRPD